jgi:N utilization substance protein A
VQIKVEADQLYLAIGKRGQNARLTSRLTGWDISIDRDESAREAFEQNVEKGVHSLASVLSVPVDIARKLMDAGMVSADVITTADPSDIAEQIGCDLTLAQQIYTAAQNELEKSSGTV